MSSFWRIAAVLALLSSASAEPARAAPEHAEIAFVSDDRIWASRADGSERRLLVAPTRPRESLSQPVCSPDGSTLAYVSALETRRDDIEAAQLMAFDGTSSQAITPLRDGVLDFSPRWSPDGTAFVFSRVVTERGFPSLVVTRQLGSGAEQPLADEDQGRRVRSGLVARRLSHPVHERSQPARGRLPRGLLRRGRRQLPHVADQRHPRERACDVAACERRPLRPRQLRPELAPGAGRRAAAVPGPRRPLARAQAPRTAAVARRAPLPVLPRLRAVRPA